VVLVWNLTADVPPRRLPIDSKPAVTALAAHADLIAVGRSNGGIELWSVEGNALLHCLPAHDDIVECLVFLADGATLISAGRDGSLLAWDPHAGKRLREFPGHANWITSLAVAPSGRWFASASDDLSLRLWDAQTGEALDRLDLAGNGVAVVALRFLSDDLLVAVTSNRLVLRFAPS
jgi:WD40 repeat protein